MSGQDEARQLRRRACCLTGHRALPSDPDERMELTHNLRKTVARLAQEGMTMLVVTHEMAFARDVSNQVVFMHQGVIREQGDPAEFFANPQSAEAQDFLARFRGAE